MLLWWQVLVNSIYKSIGLPPLYHPTLTEDEKWAKIAERIRESV